MRAKLSPELDAFVQSHYRRFGDPDARRRAYERRQEREARFGISNLTHANAQQITRAAEAGLIGDRGYDARVGGAAAPAVANQGNPFGQGSGKAPPMSAAMAGPGPGGSPTPGRPVAPPPMASPPPPVQQFTPQSALGLAMAGAARDYSLPPNKRRTFGRWG